MANKKDHIGISLSENVLKIVDVRGHAPSAKVVQCLAQDISGVSEADLPGVIQKSLKGFNTKRASVVLMVPPGVTTSKNIEIPSVDEEEIKSIVNLQASRHTPFTREEIQVGFVNIGVFKNNYTKVLLVIANRAQIKNQIFAIEKSGVKVERVLFAPEAIAQFYGASKQLRKQTTPVGVIDVGKHATNFAIIASGKVVTYRNILVGRQQIASDENSKTKLADELKVTLEAYQSEDIDQAPASYVFSSQDDQTKMLQGFLKEKLQWDVGFLPYADQAKASRTVSKKMAAQFGAYSFLDIIATAATTATTRVNLIPEEVQLQKSIEAQGREIFKAATLALTLLICVACVFAVKIHFLNTRLQSLTAKYDQSHAKVQALEKRSRIAQKIRTYLNSRMISLDTIHALYRQIPNDVYLTRITMEEDGQVSIQGVSDIGSMVYDLNKKLKEADAFDNADVKSKKAKKDRGKDAHAFEIVLTLKGTGKPEAASAEENPAGE